MEKIDEEFSKTTRILLGAALSPVQKYEEWLTRRIPKGKMVKSVFGEGKEIYLPEFSFWKFLKTSKIAALSQMKRAEALKIDGVNEGEGVRALARRLKKIAYYVGEWNEGENFNVRESNIFKDSANLYKIIDVFFSKNAAYSVYSYYDENVFGCFRAFYSKFCINCCNSSNLSGCLETDSSARSSGCYFCHNVENLQDALFCSNVKNLRYAVGNVEVGREEFLRIKGILLEHARERLAKEGKLELDVYNIGCAGGNRGIITEIKNKK